MDTEQESQLPEGYTVSEKLIRTAWIREKTALKIVLGIVLVACVLLVLLITPPKQPQKIIIFRVSEGQSVASIAQRLEQQSLVRSGAFVRAVLAITRTSDRVRSGDYIFQPRANAFSIVTSLIRGDYGDAYVWVTIPEGATNQSIASLLNSKIPSISRQKFIELAESKEGYLFPDTYHFSRLSTEEDLIKKMHDNFLSKTSALRLQVGTKSFSDAIIIASMLEHEAVNIDDARVISGIIRNRLAQNMRLQIDATLKYITGRGSADITRTDMRNKSLYNTYRYEGLPPAPIGNPGMEMITAALYPNKSNYIYYLHAPDRTAYYAVTHQDHVKNKQKYLR